MSRRLPESPNRPSHWSFDPYTPQVSIHRKPHYFTVKGRGDFPLDMLRYDSAWAVTSIEWFEGDPTKHRLVICATKFNRTSVPTTGRWESFGWQVIDHRIPKPDFLP